ncbi:MAG: universal stress protein [Gemmatimonadota bacterium]|nr:universal stress protein [Gemmatimonadota bacterium]MDH4349860.1 universal stress protein [Gemmatimonadota bacterium]MDH5196274.1 universal stress protein [Gemmatimonadota bacterium]
MTSSNWQPVVIGVDSSPAAAEAVRVGWTIARTVNVPCHLVHATPEAWTVPTAPHAGTEQPELLNEAVRDAAKSAVRDTLADAVPDEALQFLEVRTGRSATVIRDCVREWQAGLAVLGGKHHSMLGRWVSGSTAHTLVRSLDVPLFVTAHTPLPIQRIVAAVDLSDAAGPTIQAAERLAQVFGARLHIVHIVEPLPIIPDTPLQFNDDEVYRRSEEHLDQYVWPLIAYPGTTTGLRRGVAVDAITAEVAERNAEVVVLGSHGKGWVDRILIGSVTERVLSALPCSMFIVPVMGPVPHHR